MSFENVWLIPLCTTFCSVIAFFFSYMIAISNGHVTKFWPYISDSGAMPPESCIFGQLLNMAALFLAATAYLRHRQIVEFYWHRLKQVGRWRTASFVLLWVGYISAFGVSIVANFQEHNVILVHYFGALLAFGCGLIYIWAQTVFSYSMNPKLTRPIVSHCRLALCIFSTVFFFMTVIFGPILGHQPKKLEVEKPHCKKLYIWSGQEENYYEHTVGTMSEWALAICFQLYILSFVIELRHVYCHAPKLKLLAFCDEDSETNMAITQATIDLHRKLSRKGISCVTMPAMTAINMFYGGNKKTTPENAVSGDARSIQIWIKAPDTLTHLGCLRRNKSDAYLQTPRFRKTELVPKRPTCPPYNVASTISPLRDSGFLDSSTRSSANDVHGLNGASPVNSLSPPIPLLPINDLSAQSKDSESVPTPMKLTYANVAPSPLFEISPVSPQTLDSTLEDVFSEPNFAEISLANERDISSV